jgi:hypothetical protein
LNILKQAAICRLFYFKSLTLGKINLSLIKIEKV